MKNKLLYIILVVLTIATNSCGSSQIVVEKKYKWREVIAENEDIDQCVDLPIIINSNSTIIEGKKGGTKYLYLFNADKGKKIWEWSDFSDNLDQEKFSIYTDALVSDKNQLLALGNEKLYCIDLNSGTTKWKNNKTGYGRSYSGIGNTYFIIDLATNQIQNQFEEAIYTGNILNNNIFYELIIPEYTRSIPANYIYRRNINQHVPFIKNQDTMLLVTYSEPAGTLISFLEPKYGVYNITKKEWTTSNIILAKPNTYGLVYSTQIHDNKIYISTGYKILCYDLDTNIKIWEQEINSFFLSIPIFVNGNIIAQSDEGTIYAYDAQTGSSIWKSKNGTLNRGSTLEYYNGIIYYIPKGGSRQCYGINASDGKVVMQINCPNTEEYGFDSIVRIVPSSTGGKATIVVNTYKYAYGYEAVR
jgi:outer membrane protein assembly factor BamB